MDRLEKLAWGVPLVACCLLALSACPAGDARKAPKPPPSPRFDREQFMLMNLSRGPNSTGGYLAESLKRTKLVANDLDKGLRQLEQVEKVYGKSRGRPDDRFLEGPAARIKQARDTARQLETQLRDAYQDLKSSIQHTLIMEGS